MNNAEEEYYSTVFIALKHPIRRKILRMLREKPRSFSEMLGELKIESSHLTYHIDTLRDLVNKTETGVYTLSFLGEAATSMMYQVEETPKALPHRPSLSLRWKVFFSVLMISLMISLILLSGLYYVQYQRLNQVSAGYESLSETLTEVTLSAYSKDFQAATQRWTQVHGIPLEGVEIRPCYINVGTLAAWIDSAYNIELEPEGVYGYKLPWYGYYWHQFGYPEWCHPPEVISIWVQLYNRSGDSWFPGAKVLSRTLGDFACYLVNTSSHTVIGIDGFYAIALEQDFWHNSLPTLLGTSNFGLTWFKYGMDNDGSWDFDLEIKLKDSGEYYDLTLIIDWNTESAKVKTLQIKTD